jgi:hypothetical protein
MSEAWLTDQIEKLRKDVFKEIPYLVDKVKCRECHFKLDSKIAELEKRIAALEWRAGGDDGK